MRFLEFLLPEFTHRELLLERSELGHVHDLYGRALGSTFREEIPAKFVHPSRFLVIDEENELGSVLARLPAPRAGLHLHLH